jgi:hypothetical protein
MHTHTGGCKVCSVIALYLGATSMSGGKPPLIKQNPISPDISLDRLCSTLFPVLSSTDKSLFWLNKARGHLKRSKSSFTGRRKEDLLQTWQEIFVADLHVSAGTAMCSHCSMPCGAACLQQCTKIRTNIKGEG